MNDNLAPADFPRIQFPGKIHLINTNQELAQAAAELASATALGFDTETKPSFQKGEIYPVALLQLATDTDAFLFRLRTLTDFTVLANILENKEIVKVGVAIRDDLKLLQKLFKFHPEHFIELQTLAKQKGLKNLGLKGMTGEVLKSSLSKRAKMTNWDAPTLSDQQIMYAATDAWIGLKLWHEIQRPV